MAGIDPRTLDALEKVFGYSTMSVPQAKYMPVAMSGSDVIVRAATGSGKTIGFLVPALQKVARSASEGAISVLVLCPARELALQTADNARKLVSKFNGSVGVQVVIGGNNKKNDKLRGPCDILVATPGRLQHHIDSDRSFANKLQKLRVLVLDEADRMLDPGFLPAVRKIITNIGRNEARQNLLFTATLSPQVLNLAKEFVRADAVHIDAKGGTARASRSKVSHEVRVVPVEMLIPYAIRAIQDHTAAHPDGYKVILFTNTVKSAKFIAAILRAFATSDPVFRGVLELHSGMTQPQREQTSKTFADRGGIMVASDVVGRGVDFPDVSFVVQIGIAQDVQQVVHRTGRTGRGGKPGEALTLLGQDEAAVISAMKAAMPATTVVQDRLSNMPTLDDVAKQIHSIGSGIAKSEKHDRKKKNEGCDAYKGTLGFYSGQRKRLGWDPKQTVFSVRKRFNALGVENCEVSAKTLKKMNLPDV